MSSGPPWVRFFASDWLAGTRSLTATEAGVYITLVAMMYDRGEPLPADDLTLLARQCNMMPSRLKAVLDRLICANKITRTEGGLWNERVQLEHARRIQELSELKQKSYTRWAKKPSKTNGASMPRDHSGISTGARVPEPDIEIEDTSVSLSLAHSSPNGGHAPVSEKAVAGDFAIWWARITNKVGKGAARSKYAIARRVASAETLLDAWAKYEKSKPADRQWVNPATWLHQERWLDEPAPPPQLRTHFATGPPDEGAEFRAFLRKKAEGG